MDKSVDYYMGLRYTVELKPRRGGYQASLREIPECTVSVPASDSVEKLRQLLEKNQREWIERELEMGKEVPEPPGATRDPFWEKFEEGNPNYDGEDVRSALYEHGATYFPLEILEELWLRELREVRLGDVGPCGAPPKAVVDHGDQRVPWRKGDARPVRLGEGGNKCAWIELDGPRTKSGYKNVVVLDKPLRAEAAIVAALTVLEASRVEDFDFERLRKALLSYVQGRAKERLSR